MPLTAATIPPCHPHTPPACSTPSPPLNLALLAFSRVGAFDGATWWMEIAPVLVIWPLLLATHKQFPLTPLLLGLVFVHACILMLGGHYSYVRVPLGAWIQ